MTLLQALGQAQLLSAHRELRAAPLEASLQLTLLQERPSASPGALGARSNRSSESFQ